MADLRTFVLAARKSLIDDIQQQLVQLYGLTSTGDFLSEAQVPALTRGEASNELQATYKKLKQLLKDEQEAGIPPIDAIKKLSKEVAFTHLNRLVALKLLEGRKLIRGAINNWHNSNAFLFYLAEHESDQRLFEQGSQPTDDRDEGPSDRAYRHFLSWQYGRLAKEVKVLFDPDNLASRLFPRPLVLRALANELNSDELKGYWAPGNEETVGWVYQFFNAEEKEEAFGRVFKKKQKFQKEDIPAATQIFTPRWIVEYLVQNSLGRLWVTMHPDSCLASQMQYLVPLGANPTATTLKPAKEIKLLDPATGTMHFGLVAFDWLVKMYREELLSAGQTGWLAQPSVISDEEIPAAILANNLFGIDIDLRAVQLSALSLYLRAKQTNANARLSGSRLACADIAIFRGQHLNNIAQELPLPNSVTRQLFSRFCESVAEAGQMGSLVRLEEHFRNLEAERLREVIDAYVVGKAAQGQDESYFGSETSKGLRLLDLMSRRYDVVFTNPPYMSNRNMNPSMSAFMKDNYKKSKGDLYAAFIERCFELLADGGRLAMLTQQSFMFISSFEGLRDLLLKNTAIENMVHTGPRAFAEVTGEKVNTTAFVLRREGIGNLAQEATGTYFRLVKEPDALRKQKAFEEAIGRRRDGVIDARVYEYQQEHFEAIPGSPWVYWITENLRGLFKDLRKLKQIAEPRQGLATADNFRFLKFWWERGVSGIGYGCQSNTESIERPERWYPYMKGGSFLRWYGNQEYIINYGSNGREIKAHADPLYGNSGWSRIIKSTDFYFRRGVTWTDLTTGKFSGRISPGGFVFDVSGSSAFPADPELILGIMNSAWAQYALKLINPTVHVQVGDLGRLPMPASFSGALRSLVVRAVELAKTDSTENETTYDFVRPPDWPEGDVEVAERRAEIKSIEDDIDIEVYRLYQISNADRRMIEDELSRPIDLSQSESEEEPFEDEVEKEEAGSLTKGVLARQWVSYATGIALGRYMPGIPGALGRGSFSEQVIERLSPLSEQDGMMLVEKGHPDDLAQRVWDILRVVHGEKEAERIVRQATGANGEIRDTVATYLLGTFFKDHVRQYRKRPVYWLLQSPRRTFSAYLFHERATANTLSTLQGRRYLGGRIHGMESELSELLSRAAKAEGRDKAVLTNRARDAAEIIEDLKGFDVQLAAANQFQITGVDFLPKTVRWEPAVDDGILLNAAPLHELTPAWKKADAKLDLKKTWNELEAGKYDWAKTAMRYWPARVLKACKENKSFAIAHGLN